MAVVAASNAEAIRLKELRAEEARQEDLKVRTGFFLFFIFFYFYFIASFSTVV